CRFGHRVARGVPSSCDPSGGKGRAEPLAACVDPEEVGPVSESWPELTRSECFRLLGSRHLGRVGLIDELGPAAVPVHYVVDGRTMLFRTDEGSKLDAALRRGRVAFQIDGVDEASRTGWSVLVRADAVEVIDSDELAQVRELPLYPWAPGAK